MTMSTKATKIDFPNRAIRVLSVDDHDLLVQGLQSRFEHEPDIQLVGHIASAENLIKAVQEHDAQVVLLDLEMPGPDPFDALSELVRIKPDVRVIVLSAHIRDHYVDEATKSGAWGYLSKNDEVQEIVDAIRKVLDDQFVFGTTVLERCQVQRNGAGIGSAMNSQNEGVRSLKEPPKSKLDLLTKRETEVLRMIGRGMGRKEIAEELHRSPRTIDNHRASIMRKLDIADRVDLVRYAIREGLVEV